MKIFKVRISDRLFSQEDPKRSEKIVVELKELEKELPGIKLKIEELKEGPYWAACEAHRKAIRLSYPPEKLKQLQSDLWHLENRIKAPLEAHNKRCRQLERENEDLTLPLRREILEYVEKYLEEARGLRSARTLGTEKRLIDRGSRGESEITVRTMEDNFSAVEKVIDLFINFKAKVRNGMDHFSHGEIIEAVKKFELGVNLIDINVTEKREISESEWKDLRQSNLLG